MPITLTLDCFDPFVIARSGQCFRMAALSPRVVNAYAGRDRVRVTALGKSRFRFDCSPGSFYSRWQRYFDLERDYSAIESAASGHGEALVRAVDACHGLRILEQEPWETLVSFLLSQRKSIKAIQTCIEQLCERYGERVGDGDCAYHAFPLPAALLSAGEEGLRACGAGYRAPYLLDAARRVVCGGLPLEDMRALQSETLLERLLVVHGVGVKVASCVMLFGYQRLDFCPVDVWIQRVIDEDYAGRSPFADFGAHAGIYQQYLFLERLERERVKKPGSAQK